MKLQEIGFCRKIDKKSIWGDTPPHGFFFQIDSYGVRTPKRATPKLVLGSPLLAHPYINTCRKKKKKKKKEV